MSTFGEGGGVTSGLGGGGAGLKDLRIRESFYGKTFYNDSQVKTTFFFFFLGSSKNIFGFKLILSHAKTPNIEFFFLLKNVLHCIKRNLSELVSKLPLHKNLIP